MQIALQTTHALPSRAMCFIDAIQESP